MDVIVTESGLAISILTLKLKEDEEVIHYIFESDMIPSTMEESEKALPFLMSQLNVSESLDDIEEFDIRWLSNSTGLKGVPFVDFSGQS